MNWIHVALAGVVGVVLFFCLFQEPVGTLLLIVLAGWLGYRAIQAADYAAKEKKK